MDLPFLDVGRTVRLPRHLPDKGHQQTKVRIARPPAYPAAATALVLGPRFSRLGGRPKSSRAHQKAVEEKLSASAFRKVTGCPPYFLEAEGSIRLNTVLRILT